MPAKDRSASSRRPSRTAAAAALLTLAGAAPVAAQTAGFAVDPPAGWVAATDPGGARATLARDSADLAAASPAGPRIRIAASADTAAPAPEPGIDRIVEDPAATTLGGRPAVSVGFESSGPAGPLRRRVIVSSAGGSSWRVDLEAPAAAWDAAIRTMETALAGARVGGPGPIAVGAVAPAAPAAPPPPAPSAAAAGSPSGVVAAGGGGGSVRRRGPGGGALAVGVLALVALGLSAALVLARKGGLARGRTLLELEIVDPGGRARRAAIRSLPATLGRDPGCDVVLADPEASRLHARLVGGPEGIVVEDLDSAAGTALDGRPVRRAPVGSGSELALGRTRVRVL